MIVFILLSQFFGTALSQQSVIHQKDKNRGWRAANYRGLIIGKSTRVDMLRVLGKPLSSGPSADQAEPMPIVWNDYGMIAGELAGRLGVEVDGRNNRIVSISITPEKISKEDLIKYFGNDYIAMDYESCEGMPISEEVWPVYENPKSGKISSIEYRARGIAIQLNYQGKVNAIYFKASPMGLASKAECKNAIERFRRNGNRW